MTNHWFVDALKDYERGLLDKVDLCDLVVKRCEEEIERAAKDAKYREAFGDAVKDYHIAYQKAKDRITAFEAENKELKKLETQHKHNNDFLRFSLKKQEQEHQEDRDRISELELKLKAMTKSAESQCKMREELEAENAELREANKRMRPIGEFVMSDYVDPELRERDEEIKRLEAENAELKKSAEKQSAWIEDHWYVEANYPIDKAYSNALKKIKRLEAKLENCKTNHSNWDKALNQKQDRIVELEAENARLKQELTKTER